MVVYADASALLCGLLDRPDSPSWREWVVASAPELVTSGQVVAQLRAGVAGELKEVREAAADLVDELRVLRLSDQALRFAAFAQGVLSPFEALNIGVARATEDVNSFATYDSRSAAVAYLHGLKVVSPGRPNNWWDEGRRATTE